jgi:hypothetical protein
MSFGSSFGSNPLNRLMSSIPVLAKGVDHPVDVIGANGSTGCHQDDDSDDDVPVTLSFDQEQHLLLRMNDQQSKTIGELQARIARLEKELVEKPVAPVCYIKCSHCVDEEAQ